MAQLLAIKRRIKAIEGLRKVTRAMELVTHTKIGRVKKGALSSRDYQEAFERLMDAVARARNEKRAADGASTATTGTAIELVIFLSQKGFCGGFNDKLLNMVAKALPSLGDVRLTVVGRLSPKWNSIIRRKPAQTVDAPDRTWQQDTAGLAAAWAEQIRTGSDLKIIFAFNRFKSILEQTPLLQKVWPPEPPAAGNTGASSNWPVVEPDPEALFDALIGPWIEACMARSWWETAAGENCARLLSMKSANENASEIIGNLRLQYNKTRQLSITQELAEISSAFNVLNILKQKREQSED